MAIETVDWRGLLDALRIPWRDRGKNTARGKVNVCCPFCADDPSFHLAIVEDKAGYYCLRDRRHNGHNLVHLLSRFGVARYDAIQLLSAYATDAPKAQPRLGTSPDKTSIAWQRFVGAYTDDRYLDYLDHRGFDAPETVARRYDLRFAPTGTYAQRLLFPLSLDERVVSWTGRAIRKDLTPTYLMEPSTETGLIYVPRPPRQTLVIVEGPFDALKVAVASEQSQISSLALTGLAVTAAKLLRIRKLIIQHNIETVLVALDFNVPLANTTTLLAELAFLAPLRYIASMRLPANYKDAGEMALGEIMSWVNGRLQKLSCGK